jgi:hypothetical protein
VDSCSLTGIWPSYCSAICVIFISKQEKKSVHKSVYRCRIKMTLSSNSTSKSHVLPPHFGIVEY